MHASSRPAPVLTLWTALLAVFPLTVAASGTAGWRTNGTGAYPDATPPTTWSADQNVAWSQDLGDWSNSTPVVSGGRVFVGAEPTKLVCVDLASGEVLWERDNSLVDLLDDAEAEKVHAAMQAAKPKLDELREAESRLSRLRRVLRRDRNNAEALAEQAQLQARVETLNAELAEFSKYEPPQTHNDNGYSSPTPVTDGQRVFVLFGNGVAAAYDMEGNRAWIKQVGEAGLRWGMSSSPVLIDGVLVLQLGELVGLDPTTGEELWRTSSAESYGSPIGFEIDGVPVVASSGGIVVSPKTGDVLADLNDTLEYCAPVWKDGVLYFIEGDAKAYKLTTSDGRIEAERLWSSELSGDRYYASPIIHDGLIYAVTRGEEMWVLDADSGDVIYSKDLELNGPKPNSAYTSVTLAGDQLYIGCMGGTTVVVATGREFRELARNDLDRYRSSPVFVGDKMLIRGLEKLWCIQADS